MMSNKQIKSYNDGTKQVKNNMKNEKKIPNVASISDKKAS